VQFELSLPIEIRQLRDGDLDGLPWDSEEAIRAEHLREMLARRGDQLVFRRQRLYRRLGYRDDRVERGMNGERILLLRRPVPDLA
jgi:hypothetical protein